jgi:hypothetical protein
MKKQAFKFQEFVLHPAPVVRSFRKSLPSIIVILAAVLSLSTATGHEGTRQFSMSPQMSPQSRTGVIKTPVSS